MPTYMTPGVYIEEVSTGARPIQAVGTSTAAFVGSTPNRKARSDSAVAINNWSQFLREFGGEGAGSTDLSNAVYGFFLNGGRRCYVVNIGDGSSLSGSGTQRRGVQLLEPIDEVAIVAAPGFTDAASYESVISHCEAMEDRVAILDAPRDVDRIERLIEVATVSKPKTKKPEEGGEPPVEKTGGLRPRQSDRGFGAFYFPWITVVDPLGDGQLIDVAPSGHVAGIWARTDAERGVHKAPANTPVRGALNLSYHVTRDEQGELNQNGVNCIRLFGREGIRVWGARTIADGSSEWRYINVRRLFNMVEESIAESTRWVVFEPNDRTLWKSIRRDVRAFLMQLWRDGALMGATPQQAFFVQCDEETNPPEVIDQGKVVIRIGIAPVKPAEFVIFQIGQTAAGAELEAEGGI